MQTRNSLESVPRVDSGSLPKYVLITPARNEEAFLEATMRAVIAQAVHPERWIIVSDGSTDRTDEIVTGYTCSHSWIELLRLPERNERNFAAKVHAFNAGYERLKNVGYDVLGNLDADITFDQEYFRFLMEKFAADPRLGVAGTPYVEDQQQDVHTYAHRFAQLEHVSGACQMFRRACFEAIGGYIPVKWGAVDWIAVTTARMKGWRTRTFTDKVCFHHRKLGTANDHPWMVRFRYGQKAYFVGGHPVWAVARGVFQMRQKPRIFGGLFFLIGYWWCMLSRMPRPVSRELVAFHQWEQMSRLRGIFGLPRKPLSGAQLE